MKHRSLPFGKGRGGLGLDVDNCVASLSSLIVLSLQVYPEQREGPRSTLNSILNN